MSIAKVNGVELYYEIHNPENKIPVMLLNGVMMSTASWEKQLAAFSKNFQTILHDFRGQGQSTLTMPRISFNDHVEDLHLLLEHLNLKKVHLVGTSYGSEVGMCFTLKYPEYVRSLTVAAGVSESDALLKEKIRCWQRLALMAVKHQTKEEFFLGTIASNFSANYIEKHYDIFLKRAKMFNSIPDLWFIAFNNLCECFLTLDITDSLKNINVPTLIIAGLQDELKPISYSKRIQSQISHCELKEIDAGHALILEEAKIFNEIVLNFLNSVKSIC